MSSHVLMIDKLFKTPQELRQGLMNDYNPLLPGSCALFVFDRPQMVDIWMKDTPCPLDIIFIRDNMTISKVHIGAIPYDTSKITAIEPIRYVVETLTGYCKTFNIVEGDHVTFQLASSEAW